MDRVEIWLARHGQTGDNAKGRLCGWSDTLLTDLGRDQARWLHDILEGESFDGLWSSDLSRARETAQLAWGVSVPTERRLREIHFGDWEGADFCGLAPKEQDALLAFDGFRAPGGESVEQLTFRVEEFLDSLAPGRHLLFTHGGVIRAVMHRLAHTQGFFVPNGSLLGADWGLKELLFVRENPLAVEPGSG
jgi:probable phosphoglycerate mutase